MNLIARETYYGGSSINFSGVGGGTALFEWPGDRALFETYDPADYGTPFSFVFAAMGVPEPETWALFILGFGLIGAAMRRQRLAAAKSGQYGLLSQADNIND